MYMTLKNDFHGTKARLRAEPERGGTFRVSDRVRRRVAAQLCGAAGCTCGGSFGERPAIEAVPVWDKWESTPDWIINPAAPPVSATIEWLDPEARKRFFVAPGIRR